MLDDGADDTQVVPFEVSTLPFVPEEVSPVPPFAAPNALVRLSVFAVNVVPLKVRFAEPARLPELLY